MSRLKVALRWLLGAAMVAAGVLHFVDADSFARIVPAALPQHLAIVRISGAIEIGLGLGLQVERLRRVAAFGLIAFYIAVFPANVTMAVHDLPVGGHHYAVLLWLRLPLQLVLIAWAWWYTRVAPADAR